MKRLSVFLPLAFAAMSGADPLFQDDIVIDAELRGPISTLIDHKADGEEYDFDITVDDVTVGIKVRSRGNSRLRVCQFPPLRLTFFADAAEQSLFAGQHVLKLVTHCNEKSKDAGNVYNEYLAYRIFNLLSDSSYRVRLLRLTYLDTEGRLDTLSSPQHAFVVESRESLAARIGGDPVEVAGISYSRLDDTQAALSYVFQYLIGNTDWSLVTATTDKFCCHNGDLFDVVGKLVMVPYDFDLAGLVNASYAKPDSSLSIHSVRSRLYRGYCTSPHTVRNALRVVTDHRSAILDLAASIPAISSKDMQVRQRYLIDFFEKAEDEDRLIKTFERGCL